MRSRARVRVASAALVATLVVALAALPLPAVPVPRPSADTLEPAVAAELGRAHDALAAVLSDARADARSRAEAWGNLGRRYAAYELWDAAAAGFENARDLAGGVHAWNYLAGFVAQQRGALENAARALDRAAALLPGDGATWLRLGEVELLRGRAEQALAAFARAAAGGTDAGGTRAAAAFGRGRALAALGRDEEAVRAFERTLALQPAASRVHLPLAMALRRLGRSEAARRQLVLRGSVGVTAADPWIEGLGDGAAGGALAKREGDQAVIMGRLREAVGAYRRAVVADPERFAYRKSLGLTLSRLGDAEGARRELEHAARSLSSVPVPQRSRESVEIAFALGGLAANRGDDAGAAEHFLRVLAEDPCYADAHVQLGNLAGRAGDLEAALARFGQAIGCAPDHQTALLQRATVSMDLGRFAEAIVDLEHLLTLRPEHDSARHLLATARSRAAH